MDKVLAGEGPVPWASGPQEFLCLPSPAPAVFLVFWLSSTIGEQDPGEPVCQELLCLGMAGRQPQDVPTHSSPAAARQAHARNRPRVAVSGPAHHPRPAEPNTPALSEGKTWQDPDTRPHTSHQEGQAFHTASPSRGRCSQVVRGLCKGQSDRSLSRPSPQKCSRALTCC